MNTSEPDRRKLIAVVYADMIGYSRLIGLDDVGTLDRLRNLRSTLIDPAIAEHGGRLVNTGGDSLLIVFDSINGAVRCAMKVQQQVPPYDGDQPADRAIRFRVGINVGDVIPDGLDVHGDVVNVAARLQAECPPGAICVSRAVLEHLRGRLDLAFEELGALSLKNISRAVEAFVVRPDGATGRTAVAPTFAHSNSDRRTVRPTLSLPDKPALAVLPFENMSGDPEQEYFVDGLVEDLITALSRLDWMFVIARNSSFTYKGRAVDVRQVGQELGVRYVLEGSVRKVSNLVRITGQLVETTAGAHLWADRFDGSLNDVFDLQDRVTEAVAGAIEPRLQRAEIERAQLKSTQDLSAYDFYLRGMASYYQMTKESLEAAKGLFCKAIAVDRNYAAALAMMAECIGEQNAHGWITDYERDMGEGMQWARRAIAVGKDDSTAWLDSHLHILPARQTLPWPCLSGPVCSIRTWPWHGATWATFRLTSVIQIEGLRALSGLFVSVRLIRTWTCFYEVWHVPISLPDVTTTPSRGGSGYCGRSQDHRMHSAL